jgi:SAM-dependent methyltransferase
VRRCLQCENQWGAPTWRCPRCAFEPPLLEGVTTFAPEVAYGNDGFPSIAFQHLVELEHGNFWFVGRNELIMWLMRRYFSGITSLCELGCGNGFVLSRIEQELPDARLIGSDLYLDGLKRAATHLRRSTLLQLDARKIPFRDEFDIVGCFDALEHIEQDEHVLSEIHAALHPGGGVLISVPQHPALWSVVDEYSCHVRRYRAAELREKMQRAGFVVERMTSFVCLLLPVMYLRRQATSRNNKPFDPVAELTIPPVLNKLLGGVLTTEAAFIKAGVDLPFGGSLFAVGRRAG